MSKNDSERRKNDFERRIKVLNFDKRFL
jgi:hypothetical protein